jgi:hypothetical protein
MTNDATATLGAGFPLFCPEDEETDTLIKTEDQPASNDDPMPSPPVPQPAQKKTTTTIRRLEVQSQRKRNAAVRPLDSKPTKKAKKRRYNELLFIGAGSVLGASLNNYPDCESSIPKERPRRRWCAKEDRIQKSTYPPNFEPRQSARQRSNCCRKSSCGS